MTETGQSFVTWLMKQNPSKPIDQMDYSRCALGLFYKELDVRLDIQTSPVYAELCSNHLMYDINQNKTYGGVHKLIKQRIKDGNLSYDI